MLTYLGYLPLVLEDLGCDVVGCAAGGVQQVAVVLGAVQSREAEVRDLQSRLVIQQQILRLEVAVADLGG